MNASMTEKVWLITGCSSGFGRALAEAALERGDRVVATARQSAALLELAARWPGTVHLAELDVTDSRQCQSVVEEAVGVFGRVDVLVNNAGYGLVGAVEEATPAQIERNFAVNFFGPLALIRAALPHFRAAKSGHIVNISAAAAIANYAGFGIYGAAKCALEGVSESLALEGRAFGLKVTLVQPGPFRTDFISRGLERSPSDLPEYEASSGKFAKFLATIDGKQPGNPAAAAQAILRAVDAERPPQRLVLGKYALEKSRRTLAQREAELKTWEETSLNADSQA
jgi:NAD(P)-dependent dehydrogenase (short-subunit alcohol dehydrogenase family)